MEQHLYLKGSKILLLQKFNDRWGKVLKHFIFSLWPHGGCQRPFLFLYYEGCVICKFIFKSYCCAVGIGQQAFRAVGIGGGGSTYPQFLANYSLEQKAEGLWFLYQLFAKPIYYFIWLFAKTFKFQISACLQVASESNSIKAKSINFVTLTTALHCTVHYVSRYFLSLVIPYLTWNLQSYVWIAALP